MGRSVAITSWGSGDMYRRLIHSLLHVQFWGISLGTSEVQHATRFPCIIFTSIANMTRRKPLRNIPVNISTRQELSNDTKQRLYGRALAGETGGEVATAEGLQESTVYHAIKRISERQTTTNLYRSGRPKQHSTRDDRKLVRYARLHPKFTYEQLAKETGVHFERSTLRSILRSAGIVDWRSKKRPALTQYHANLRLQFALANVNTD
jgi:transposase